MLNVGKFDVHIYIYAWLSQWSHFPVTMHGVNQVQNVTEFWKITHMGVCEIIRIFMFSEEGAVLKIFQEVSCNLRH